MSAASLLRLTAFLLLFAVCTPSGIGQQPTEPTDTESNQDGAVAADATAPKNVALSVAPAGAGRNRAGRWSTLSVNGLNRTDEDSEELGIVTIGDRTNLQYARKFWIPAYSKRQGWINVQIPEDIADNQLQVPMTTMHLKATESGESFQPNVVGMTKSSRGLLIARSKVVTGAILAPRDPSPADADRADVLSRTIYSAMDAVIVDEQDLGLVELSGGFIPPTANPLDALDVIVVANDSILQDTVAVQRFQSWLQSGGNVWIMADQLKPESVRALLGDSSCYSVVDEVELNDYTMVVPPAHSSAKEATYDWTTEQPVTLLRVLADTDEVESTIDGWPAAFWKDVGQGRVLFTTLGAKGWLKEGDVPITPLTSIAEDLFAQKSEPADQVARISRFLDQEIGYTIPSRATVATILGLHLLFVFGIGIWLVRKQALQYLAVLIPVTALLAMGSLIAIGKANTSQVPSTIATGQIARALPGSASLRMESVNAIFSQERQPLPITVAADTTALMVGESDSSELMRIVWDDSGKSTWEFVDQPPGVVRHVKSQSLVTLPQPWKVVGKFTENGFEGALQGIQASTVQDPVIASSPSPSLAVEFDPDSDGRFIASKMLERDQYIDSALVTDTQQQRQQFIREVVSGEGSPVSETPSLLLWTEPVPTGTTFGDGFGREGWALASIPIRIDRVAPGESFMIPPIFVSLRASSRGPSIFFDTTIGKTPDSFNKPGKFEVRCVPPSAVLPCEISSAVIALRAIAPGRTMTIRGFNGDQPVTLLEQASPNGRVEFIVDNPEVLGLDAEGGLPIEVSFSQTEKEKIAESQSLSRTEQQSSTNSWSVDYFNVTLKGTAE